MPEHKTWGEVEAAVADPTTPAGATAVEMLRLLALGEAVKELQRLCRQLEAAELNLEIARGMYRKAIVELHDDHGQSYADIGRTVGVTAQRVHAIVKRTRG